VSDFRSCIGKGIASGHMTPDQGGKADDLYQGYLDDFEKTMSEGEAKRKAGQSAFTALEAQAAHKRRQFRLAENRAGIIDNQLDLYRNLKGEPDKAAAMLAHLEYDGVGNFSNVRARRDVVNKLAWAKVSKLIINFQRDLVGRTPRKAQLANVVDELFGNKTGDASAKAMSEAWSEAAEFLRLRFNAAGGAIGKLENWGLPTRHDARLVRRSSFQEWRDFISPLIDRKKMIDDLTGQPLSGARLETALHGVYEAVSSEGWSKRTPSRGATGSSLVNRRGQERFIAWRDGASWRAYQEKFGSADAFHVMMDHIDGMARDIGAMEILGPNPKASLGWMADVVKKDAATRKLKFKPGTSQAVRAKSREKLINRAKSKISTGEKMFALYMGENRIAANVPTANFFKGVRSGLISSQLGSTTLLAVPTDVANQVVARKFAGMKTTGIIRQSAKLLNPLNKADQELAIRSGLGAENAARLGLAQARFVGEVEGSRIMDQISDTVLRATGLSPWTQASRWSMGFEFQGHLADNASKIFDQLPKGTQRILTRHGLAGAWDEIRRAPISAERGKRLLTPESISKIESLTPSRSDELSVKLLEMISTEQEFATPTSSLRGQAFISSSEPAGTVMGEISRSFQMYKAFPATITFMHGRRALSEANFEGKPAGFKYAFSVVMLTTIAGVLATEMREIAKGKDPRSLQDPNLWVSAMLSGGGLGIWGDFLTAQESRAGGGLTETAAGPMVGAAGDVLDLTVGNVFAAFDPEKDVDLASDLTKTLKRYVPGSNGWYTRLIYNRMFVDQIQSMLDPEAQKKFRRKQRRSQRETGQDFFWSPGQALPDRAPDLGAALDPAPQ